MASKRLFWRDSSRSSGRLRRWWSARPKCLIYKFLTFSMIGGLLWICSMVLAGYFLGGVIERALGIKLEDHIEKVVIVVVLLSLLPPMIEFLKQRFGKKATANGWNQERLTV